MIKGVLSKYVDREIEIQGKTHRFKYILRRHILENRKHLNLIIKFCNRI